MVKTILVTEKGTVRVLGVDFETNRIKVFALNSKSIVLKIPGRNCWDGNYCPRKYHSPEILIYRILHKFTKDGVTTFKVEPLIEWTEKRNLKKKTGD